MADDNAPPAALTAEIERLREALEFYANPKTYSGVWDAKIKSKFWAIHADRGNIARAALSPSNNKKDDECRNS